MKTHDFDVIETEARRVAELAIGRIFRMGSRPYQEGDLEEYERCRAIAFEAHDTMTERSAT